MLNKEQLDRLNQQIQVEAYASNFYLAASCWCHYKGFQGCGEFLGVHAEQESMHMRKLMDYVLQTGGHATVGEVKAPPSEFSGMKELFEKIFQHEKEITAKINSLVGYFLDQKDFSTFNFLQWYVAEQHEEEHLFRTIMEKIDMIGDQPSRLFWIDKEIRKLARTPKPPATGIS